MKEGLLGIALLLSVPVALGVTAAVDVTTGRLPFALLWGASAFAAIFLLVVGAGSYGSVETGDTDDVVTGVDATTEGSDGSRAAGATAAGQPPVSEEAADQAPATSVDLLLGAGMGAVVTVLVWYLPGSPLLGGIAAGYMAGGTREDSLRAALLAGILVPLVVLTVAAAAFLIAGAQVIGRFPFGPTVAIAVAAVGLVYVVGFSVAGGQISVRMREE